MAMAMSARPHVRLPTELELGGQEVTVKNTFLDVPRTPSPTMQRAHRRCKSVPSLFFAAPMDQDLCSEGEEEEMDLKASFQQRRQRASTCAADDFGASDKLEAAEVMSNSSTRVPESSAAASSSSPSAVTIEKQQEEEKEEEMQRRASLAARSTFVSECSTRWRVSSWADEEDTEEEPPSVGEATTMMFRNLPETFTRSELEALLDAEGFAAVYDFIYLPANLSTGSCFGYAFINFTTPQVSARFMRHFQGFTRWSKPTDKRAHVHVSEGIQGRAEQCERYRNSAFMHESVADQFKPAIYEQGVRMPFPAPTVPLKAPRVRGAKGSQQQQQPQSQAQQHVAQTQEKPKAMPVVNGPSRAQRSQQTAPQQDSAAPAGRARAGWMFMRRRFAGGKA